MGYLISLRCPFCGLTTQSWKGPKTTRIRICVHCHKEFFYYRNKYYIKITDIQNIILLIKSGGKIDEQKR